MLTDKYNHELSLYSASEMYLSMKRALRDKDKDARLAIPLCPYCFYMKSSLAFSAFTRYVCICCEKEFDYPNSACPKLCTTCAKHKNVCMKCAGVLFDFKESVKGKRA